MKKIYVIVGESGEYSSRSEWCVKAFETERKAMQKVIEMEGGARLIAERCRWDYEGKDKIETWSDDEEVIKAGEFIGDPKLPNLFERETLKYRYETITLED